MFRFENPTVLQFLWIIPIVFILFIVFQKQQLARLKKAFESKLLKYMMASVSVKKRGAKVTLQALCLILMILALARPQSGQGEKQVRSEGVELVFMFDVSSSMLAEDVKPSRLELAKKEISRFIDMSLGHRVGLIAFAGNAVLLSPVTQDRGALKMYIESLSTDVVSTQGTVFKKPLSMAAEAFKRGGAESSPDTSVTRVVVIVSDGEDNEPGAIEEAHKLVSQGIRIFTLGFGSEKGAPIPIKNQRHETVGYKKDKAGKTIMTKTKGTVLKKLAQAGKGSFYHVSFGGSVINYLLEDLDKLEKSTFDATKISNYDEHFQWPLFFAILVGLIELVLGERKSPSRIWRGRFTA